MDNSALAKDEEETYESDFDVSQTNLYGAQNANEAVSAKVKSISREHRKSRKNSSPNRSKT